MRNWPPCIVLQALVSHCPLLSGRVIPLLFDECNDSLKDWHTIMPDRGLDFVMKDLRPTMPSFEGAEEAAFPPPQLPYDLLMRIPDDIDNDRPFAACKVQFSAIDGGTILTFATSHSAADENGTNELLRVVSEETRLTQEHSIEAEVNEVPQNPFLRIRVWTEPFCAT